MFKMIFDIWKAHKVVTGLIDSFIEMLEMDRDMFLRVLDVLQGKIQRVDVQAEVYRRDVEINRRERSIRREIVEYLTANPSGDVPACLVLMSVVKDGERVGDYSKNLLEVAQVLDKSMADLRYRAEISEISEHVVKIFDDTIRAYRNSDAELAKDVVSDEAAMTKRCDALIEQVARSDLTANEAVCTAMLMRFLKRIEAHLSNICSSLVLPVHRIDGRLTYKSKKDRAQGAGESAQPGGDDQ